MLLIQSLLYTEEGKIGSILNTNPFRHFLKVSKFVVVVNIGSGLKQSLVYNPWIITQYFVKFTYE